MSGIKSRGRGRGVLALTSFEPLPRPAALKNTLLLNNDQKKPVNIVKPMTVVQNGSNNVVQNGNTTVVQNGEGPTKDIDSSLKGLKKLIAKYNYKANPEQPGGFKELTITQKETLFLIQQGHLPTKNHLWWEVANAKNERGFVPGNYCMELEVKPANLPWLENKRLEEEKKREEEAKQAALNRDKGSFGRGPVPNQKPVVKPYMSSYDKTLPKGANAAQAAREFCCEICDKNLNGPQPYKMHMSSKAHREEVEYQATK